MILGICGYSRQGKGTAAEYISDRTGLEYTESTSTAARRIAWRKLCRKYGYETPEDCWEDRHNHRAEWAEIIWKYNQPDGIRLYREMLPDNDIIEGIRKTAELQAMRDAGLMDLVLWVDALGRVPVEDPSSCQIVPGDCDVIIHNDGTPTEFRARLDRFIAEHLTETRATR